MNNRKWTDDQFQSTEKINCNFLLTIMQADNNVFKGTLTVQAAMLVFNSTYVTPLINLQDEAVTFKYVDYQPIEFNENRISGSDGLGIQSLPHHSRFMCIYPGVLIMIHFH